MLTHIITRATVSLGCNRCSYLCGQLSESASESIGQWTHHVLSSGPQNKLIHSSHYSHAASAKSLPKAQLPPVQVEASFLVQIITNYLNEFSPFILALSSLGSIQEVTNSLNKSLQGPLLCRELAGILCCWRRSLRSPRISLTFQTLLSLTFFTMAFGGPRNKPLG